MQVPTHTGEHANEPRSSAEQQPEPRERWRQQQRRRPLETWGQGRAPPLARAVPVTSAATLLAGTVYDMTSTRASYCSALFYQLLIPCTIILLFLFAGPSCIYECIHHGAALLIHFEFRHPLHL